MYMVPRMLAHAAKATAQSFAEIVEPSVQPIDMPVQLSKAGGIV